MKKICPRCQKTVTCQSQDIQSCACRQLTLAPATHAYLQQTQYDCLCNDCLRELDTLVAKAQSQPFPQGANALQEGLHYYLEHGRWVMTEFYLLQRGYCCGNGCRHCAYGYKQ